MSAQHQVPRPARSARRLAWRVGRYLYCRARREPQTDDINSDGETYIQRCVIAAVGPSDVLSVIDIGANVGDWTRPLVASLGPDRLTSDRTRLHLVEPVPATRDMLKQRLAGSPALSLAEIHAFALSDTCGQSRMNIVAETGGRNGLVGDGAHQSGEIVVETRTLTSLFEDKAIGRAQLVKCDAEGYDLAIMRGARDLLAEGRIDVLQFEYNHTWVFSRSFLKDVFDLIEGLPYVVGRVCPDAVEVYEGWHPELERFFHSNYVLIREPALAWFKTHQGSFDISNTYA